MISPDRETDFDSKPPEARAMFDPLIAGFLADPAASLVAPSRVLTRSGQLVALVADTQELAALYADPTVQHVIIVGDAPVAIPLRLIGRRMGVHRIDGSGQVQRIARPALPELVAARTAAASAPPLTPELVAERLARGTQRAGEMNQLTAALRGRFPWVTTSIASVCVVLFGLGELWGRGDLSHVLVRMGANSRALVAAGQVWRVLSSAFLHLNFEHLVVNMGALVSFGLLLERLLGARRYLVLYGLSALGGGLASALFGRGISVGASGAIWGLMTAGIALAIRPRGLLPSVALARARRGAAVPLVINLLYSFAPGIDLFGHFGGGLAGFVLMLSGTVTAGVEPAWTDAPRAPRRPAPLAGLLAALIVLAAAASIGLALASGRPWSVGEPPALRTVALGETGLSLDIPESIAGALQRHAQHSVELFDYVVAGEPLAVEVVVVSLGAKPGDPEVALGVIGKAMESAQLQGAQRLGPATTVGVGARRFTTVKYRLSAASIQAWATIMGDREVIVRVVSFGDLPSGWAGLPEKIVASLR
jgi:membrane associated rhomboid family serine protease